LRRERHYPFIRYIQCPWSEYEQPADLCGVCPYYAGMLRDRGSAQITGVLCTYEADRGTRLPITYLYE